MVAYGPLTTGEALWEQYCVGLFIQGVASDLEGDSLVYRLQFFGIRTYDSENRYTPALHYGVVLMMATLCRVETFLYLLFVSVFEKETRIIISGGPSRFVVCGLFEDRE